MIHIKQFEFSPFQENTYVIYADNKDCWIIDPGCYYPEEKQELKGFIASKDLRPKRLLNTHCHLDHIFGNATVHQAYDLQPEYHKADAPTMAMAPQSASLYGIPGFEISPEPAGFLNSGEHIYLDGVAFEIRLCPGHAPGHVVFVQHDQKMVVGGDVLFRESIGRTDLPGGNHESLLTGIRTQLFTLGDDYVVYPGHGPFTTIGHEKKYNPFL